MPSAAASLYGVKNPYLQLLLEKGLDSSPIQSHWQGADRLSKALLLGLELRDQDVKDRDAAKLMQNLPGLEGSPPMAPAPMQPPIQPPMQPGPQMMPQQAPRGMMPATQEGAPARAMVPSTNRVIGDQEAINSGLYDPPNQQMASANPGMMPSAQPPAPMPQQMAQAPQAVPQQRSPTGIDPRMAAQIKAMIGSRDPLLKQQGWQLYLQFAKPTDRFEPVLNARGEPVGQRSTLTGEKKADPTRPEYHIQQRDDGSTVIVNKNDPSDYRVVTPAGASRDIAQHKGNVQREEESGKATGKAKFSLPATLQKAKLALDTIEKIRTHPGRQYGTGVLGGLPTLPGSPQRGFANLVDQAKGQAFLEAFESLKGGGQITEVEGAKATAAIARMDRAQDDKDFEDALNDLSSIVKMGVGRAETQAGQPQAQSSDGWRELSPGVRIRQRQ